MIDIRTVSTKTAHTFLDAYHPLRTGGSLRGALHILAGYEGGWPTFLAVFTTPRSRWRNYPVTLELSRLAWSPLAKASASTFLRKCLRMLRREHCGVVSACGGTLIVTYALPGTDGIVYERAGFSHNGYSGGCAWSHRGPGERLTPDTIGTGRKLKRFFAPLGPDDTGGMG